MWQWPIKDRQLLGGCGHSLCESVMFYRLADYRLAGSELWRGTRVLLVTAGSRKALRDVLADESEWEGVLGV